VSDEQTPAPEPRPTPLERWVAYRRTRIEAEVERGRNSRVPTWAMALFLVLFAAAWIGYIALVG
jgi:hypothetical protein